MCAHLLIATHNNMNKLNFCVLLQRELFYELNWNSIKFCTIRDFVCYFT